MARQLILEQRSNKNERAYELRRTRLANESPMQKEQRLAASRAKSAARRDAMSPEEKARKSERAKVRLQDKLGAMTPTELESHKMKNALKAAAREDRRREELGEVGYRAYLDKKNIKNYSRKFHVRLWFERMRAQDCCSECGEDRPEILQYHHFDRFGEIDQKNKKMQKGDEVGSFVERGIDIERIKEELAKCVCLCSNCHDMLHAVERHTEKAKKVSKGVEYYSERFKEDGRVRLDFDEPKLYGVT